MKKTLVICDIQPEYEKYFKFDTEAFCKHLNQVYHRYTEVIFFYSGYETLNMIKEHELIEWLYENGVNDKTLDAITFIDKGYGFIIDAIDDKTINEQDLLNGIEYLASKYESDETLDMFINDNQMHYNEAMPIIESINTPIIFYGGSTEACLLELIFIAKAISKKYTIDKRYTYE